MAITFDTLKANAKIFEELKKNPSWWVRLKNDTSLYIEIRKDNQVNVYSEGGSIARVRYCIKHKKLQVFTHHKYLGLPAPSNSNPYIECSDIIENPAIEGSKILVCDEIIRRVKECYSRKHAIDGLYPKESWSEKFIQGSLIIQSSGFHLDSEFAYNDSGVLNRIDLIRCDEGEVSFVELKRMSDGRMLHKTDESPEIIEQMERYRSFIQRNEVELLDYYQTLYDIKESLQLPVPNERPTRINLEPHLLIFDCWEKDTDGRDIHRKRLIEILQREYIDFSIKSEIEQVNVRSMIRDKNWSGYNVDKLDSQTTGLPFDVYVVANRYFEFPIVKVVTEQLKATIFHVESPVKVETEKFLEPKEIEMIKSWIDLNREILLKYWNGDISTVKLLNDLKKIHNSDR